MQVSQPQLRRRPAASRRGGFTLVELLIVAFILLVLMSLLVPVVAKVRQSQRSVQCIATLGKIASGFQSYAIENRGRLPDPGLVDKSWEQIISPYYSGKFECPGDLELFPALGSSYDWRDTGNDSTTLAGKLLMSISQPNAILVFDALPGWHERGAINVARIDGSAGAMNEEECFRDLATPIWPVK